MTLTFGHLFQWSSRKKTWERFYNRAFFPISAGGNKQEGRKEEEEISPSSFLLNVHFIHNHTRELNTTVPRAETTLVSTAAPPPSTGLACGGTQPLLAEHVSGQTHTKQWPQPAKHLPWSVAELSISVVRLTTDKKWM